MPSRRLKELIEGTVDHHASQRWPALEEVTISWRGSYGYLTGYLSEDNDDTIKLCRIQYWTPTGFVDTIRSGTMVYEERTGSGTGSQEVHPGV